MKKLNNIIIIIGVFTAILFTACEKEPIDTTIEPIEPVIVETEEILENPLIKSIGKMSTTGFSFECIVINYPFAFELQSGISVTINDSTEIEVALYNEDDYIIDFVYPLEAVDQNGEVFTIYNTDELAKAFIECVPTEGWNGFEEAGFPAFDFEGLCVDLVYPITLLSENGVTAIAANEQEFADALINGFYYFSFPIDVIDKEGKITAIDNDLTLIDAIFNCSNYNEPYITVGSLEFGFCFDLNYPLQMIDEKGNTNTVNNEDELYTLLFSGQVVDFVYPISLISQDGITLTANDQNALNDLTKDCYNYYIPANYDPFEFCFDIEYPIELTDTIGNTFLVNSDTALFEIFQYNNYNAPDFIYPLIAILLDGTIITINDSNVLNNLVQNCSINGYESPELDIYSILDFLLTLEYFCFDINYPISITIDGIVETIDNETELNSIAIEIFPNNSFTNIEFNFPINVTLSSDSSIVTINEASKLTEYIYNCP